MKPTLIILSGLFLGTFLPLPAQAISGDQLLDAMKSQEGSQALPPDKIGGKACEPS